jgi:hypothetical protein
MRLHVGHQPSLLKNSSVLAVDATVSIAGKKIALPSEAAGERGCSTRIPNRAESLPSTRARCPLCSLRAIVTADLGNQAPNLAAHHRAHIVIEHEVDAGPGPLRGSLRRSR